MANNLVKPTKKRVLLVVRWPVGGIRTFLRYVYTRFDPDQWHFTILTVPCSDSEALVEDMDGCDVRFIFVPNMPTDGSSGILLFTRYVTSALLRSRFDLVHSHGFTSAMGVALLAFFTRTKHIMTSHETLNVNQFLGFRGALKKWCIGKFFLLIDRVHSVSYDAQQNLFDFFPVLKNKSEKCVVIQNGIDVDRFLNAAPIDLREKRYEKNVFLIGFFGRFMSPKGFRYLVEAIGILTTDKTLEKRPLVMAFGGGGFIDREQRNIKEKGLERYFQFMPFEPNIAGVIKGVNVVVMPSLWEACPLLPMEALVCGIPLIATDCIGLREVTRGTPAVQVSVRDAKSLASEIGGMMEGNCEKKFKDFSAEAVKRFDVSVQAKAIKEIYTKTMKV